MEMEFVRIRNKTMSPIIVSDATGQGYHLPPCKNKHILGGWKRVPRECLSLSVNQNILHKIQIDTGSSEIKVTPEVISEVTESSIKPGISVKKAPAKTSFPEVSVIIVNKDYTKFIDACLEGLQAQTFKDFEVVLVDYGSVDEFYSPEKFDTLCGDTPHRYIFEKSDDVQLARNAGVKFSTGKYFVVVDADVVLRPEFISYMYEVLTQASEDIGYVYCNFQNHFTDGKTNFNRYYPFSASRLSEKNFGSMCSLVKKEWFPGFDPNVRRLQDWDLWISMYTRFNKKGLWVDETLFDHYIEGIKNISKRMTWQAGVQVLRNKHNTFFHSSSALNSNKFVDIIIPTYNNAEWTIKCITSIRKHTDDYPYRIVWVDNGSEKEEIESVRSVIANMPHVQILNNKNLGFVKAANQGLRYGANGDYVVIMNNDTIVTKGWLSRMVLIMERDENIALVGPMTENASGNERSWQSISALKDQMRVNSVLKNTFGDFPDFNRYNSIDEFAEELYKMQGMKYVVNKTMLAFFCTLFRVSAINKVGLLDEDFGVGLGDDDEYCFRLRKAGYYFALAKGVFVFHNHRTTFNKLYGKEGYKQMQKENMAILRKKTGL